VEAGGRSNCGRRINSEKSRVAGGLESGYERRLRLREKSTHERKRTRSREEKEDQVAGGRSSREPSVFLSWPLKVARFATPVLPN